MSIVTSLSIIILAGLIHASFQLSVSMLTMLSSHTIGAKKSQKKLLQLTISYLIGAGFMTILVLSFIAFIFINIFGSNIPQIVWAATCGLLIGVAVSIWLFYYRREKGTMLWIPRNIARYLSERTKAVKICAEAFGLGLSSVTGELLFIIAPITVSALVLIQLPSIWQLIGIVVYSLISMFPLLTVWVSISSGHSLSSIQRWRESNKTFLQFAAGTGLIILGGFVYVNEILTIVVGK